MNGPKITDWFVNGNSVKVLRDTGCTAIFISEQFVAYEDLTGKERGVTLADGSTKVCNEAQIKIDTPYISGVVDALVMNNPFADLAVGKFGYVHSQFRDRESFQAVTRSMFEKEKLNEILQQKAYTKWKDDI